MPEIGASGDPRLPDRHGRTRAGAGRQAAGQRPSGRPVAGDQPPAGADRPPASADHTATGRPTPGGHSSGRPAAANGRPDPGERPSIRPAAAHPAPRDPGRDPAATDEELVEAVRAGATAAFQDLYQRHVAVARRLAGTLTPDPEHADILVAEAFGRVLAALRGGSAPTPAFRAYLLVTLRALAHRGTG